jgi:hypothetical protein
VSSEQNAGDAGRDEVARSARSRPPARASAIFSSQRPRQRGCAGSIRLGPDRVAGSEVVVVRFVARTQQPRKRMHHSSTTSCTM